MSSQLFSKSNLLFGLLVILLLFLQHRLWLGDGGREELDKLKQEYQQINEKANKMKETNLALAAEVKSLKHGLEAIEGRARRDLGMIKEGETYYQIIPSR